MNRIPHSIYLRRTLKSCEGKQFEDFPGFRCGGFSGSRILGHLGLANKGVGV